MYLFLFLLFCSLHFSSAYMKLSKRVIALFCTFIFFNISPCLGYISDSPSANFIVASSDYLLFFQSLRDRIQKFENAAASPIPQMGTSPSAKAKKLNLSTSLSLERGINNKQTKQKETASELRSSITVSAIDYTKTVEYVENNNRSETERKPYRKCLILATSASKVS